MKKSCLELAINYTHNILSCSHHNDNDVRSILPDVIIMSASGFYLKNIDKIENSLFDETRGNILQIVSRVPVNAMQLKKIFRYSYPMIRKSLASLNSLKIISFKKSKNASGKKEFKILLHKGVSAFSLNKQVQGLSSRIDSSLLNSETGFAEFESGINAELARISKQKTIRTSER